MRRLAIVAAMLTLATPVWAKAQHASVTFDGLCGGADLTIAHGIVAGKMTGCNPNVATGTVGSVKTFGPALTVNTYSNDAQQWVIYVLQYPLVTGGRMCTFSTLDGQEILNGICTSYTVHNAAQ